MAKNTFWERLEEMKQELGEDAVTEEATEEELPPEENTEDEGPNIEAMKMEDIASKEDTQELLINRFDRQMDGMARGVIDLMKTVIDMAEEDAEFAPVKERIKECFSRGVVPYLEDADRAFYEFYPEYDPRMRRVKG